MATSSSLTLTLLVTLALAISISTTQAQQTCAAKLIPCAEYLNSTTTPPNSCCDPIKEAVATDLQCLCNLYENPSFLSGIGINVEQALNLPRLCGIPSDTSACKTAEAPGGSSAKPPPDDDEDQTPPAVLQRPIGKKKAYRLEKEKHEDEKFLEQLTKFNIQQEKRTKLREDKNRLLELRVICMDTSGLSEEAKALVEEEKAAIMERMRASRNV